MSSEKNSRLLRRNRLTRQDIVFFLALGVVQGATAFVLTVMPQHEAYGVIFTAVLCTVLLVNRLYERFAIVPVSRKLRTIGVIYSIVAVVVLAGPIGLKASFYPAGSDSAWLPWLLAAITFAVMSGGAWFVAEQRLPVAIAPESQQ